MAPDSMEHLGAIAFGSLFLLGALLMRGTIVPRSRITQFVRATYVTRSHATTMFPFSYRRILAAQLPIAMGLFLGGWLPVLAPESREIAWAIAFGFAASFGLAVLAFVWPRPFLPRWVLDVDRGRNVGIDPDVLIRFERANAPLSPRTFRLANAGFSMALLAAFGLQAPATVFFGILMGWGLLLTAQSAR